MLALRIEGGRVLARNVGECALQVNGYLASGLPLTCTLAPDQEREVIAVYGQVSRPETRHCSNCGETLGEAIPLGEPCPLCGEKL